MLFQEGGFYMDLDVELSFPLHELVDESTTFMSVYESPDDDPTSGVLNALLAVAPGSTVMKHALHHIAMWYREEMSWRRDKRMGPYTLMQGMLEVVQSECPSENVTLRKQQFSSPNAPQQWTCGSHEFRMYMQINCSKTWDSNPEICTGAHSNSTFEGLNYVLVKPGVRGTLLGFPRPKWCETSGCGFGGNMSRLWYEDWRRGNVTLIPVALNEANMYFHLQTASAQPEKEGTSKSTWRIPRQLVLTGHGKFEHLPDMVKSKVTKLLHAEGFNLRWLSDSDCFYYISKFFGRELKKVVLHGISWGFPWRLVQNGGPAPRGRFLYGSGCGVATPPQQSCGYAHKFHVCV